MQPAHAKKQADNPKRRPKGHLARATFLRICLIGVGACGMLSVRGQVRRCPVSVPASAEGVMRASAGVDEW